MSIVTKYCQHLYSDISYNTHISLLNEYKLRNLSDIENLNEIAENTFPLKTLSILYVTGEVRLVCVRSAHFLALGRYLLAFNTFISLYI